MTQRRARRYAVVGIVGAGALGVVSSTQTWLVTTLADTAADELAVAGAAALPVLAPLSLAMLALGLALSIVGRVLRYAFGLLTVAAGVVLAVATAQIAIARPIAAVASTVTDATGIAGVNAVAELVSNVAATPWPWVMLAGWAVLITAGLFTLLTARQWQSLGRRFRTDQATAPTEGASTPDEATAPLDAFDSWDGLSRGEDPTAGSGPR